jgi:hypothetical protein
MKTGYVQIFSNQSATFNHPNDYETKVRVEAFKFEDVPEWVLESKMYKLLVKSNKIKLITGKEDVASVEKANGKLKHAEINEALNNQDNAQGSDSVSEQPIDYSNMKASELYNLCLEKGIKADIKQSKDYYINLLS